MSHATISRGLKVLKEKKLIDLIQVDFKHGNLWQVSAIACASPGNDDKPPRNRVARDETTQLAPLDTSKKDGHPPITITEPTQNEHDLRSSKKEKFIKESEPLFHLAERCFGDGEEILRSFTTELDEEEQSRVVNDFMAREYPHGFLPPPQVVRALAARDWFSNKTIAVWSAKASARTSS